MPGFVIFFAIFPSRGDYRGKRIAKRVQRGEEDLHVLAFESLGRVTYKERADGILLGTRSPQGKLKEARPLEHGCKYKGSW